MPALPFATRVTCVRHPDFDPGRIAAALRARDLPIICRVRDEALIFDCRTLSNEEIDQIPTALAETLREMNSE